MKIIDRLYFDQFLSAIGNRLDELIRQFDFSDQKRDLEYQTQVSAVYSS